MRSHPLLVARLCDTDIQSAQMCRRRWCSPSEYTNSANRYTNTQAPVVHTDKECRVVSPGVWAAAVLRRWCVDLWAAA